MVTINANNSKQMTYLYLGGEIRTEKITIPTNDSFCGCNDFDIQYNEFVFCDVDNPNDIYKNDKTSFFIDLFKTTDSKTFKLIKNGVDIPLVNNTFGTYFDVNTFDNFPKRCGFLIDWLKVYLVHGEGEYVYQIDYEYIGSPISITSRTFELSLFDIEKADGTVKIESYHNGKIEGGTDYSGMNWYKSYRFFGNVLGEKYQLETDNYQDQDRVLTQIQDKVIINHTVSYRLIDTKQMNEIVLDQTLSDKILISSYEVNAFKEINRIESYPVEFQDLAFYKNSNKAFINIEYTNKKQNIIKRKYM